MIVFTSVSRVLCGSCGCVYWKEQASSSACIGITTLNFRLVFLALWRQDVNGAEMVVVLIFVWLFVIHVLHKLPEVASIDVATLKMVDSVLQRNVLQVLLLLSRAVDEQVVGVGQHHALGKRLTSQLRFLEAEPVHTCVSSLVP